MRNNFMKSNAERITDEESARAHINKIVKTYVRLYGPDKYAKKMKLQFLEK